VLGATLHIPAWYEIVNYQMILLCEKVRHEQSRQIPLPFRCRHRFGTQIFPAGGLAELVHTTDIPQIFDV
jgi:hypothetical protein